MGKYTKISKKKYADGGPIKKVRISDKGVVKDVPINTKEYKQYYDSKTLAKASEDPNLLIAAQDLNPVEVKAEKPTWLTFKEEAEKEYPQSKFITEYFPPYNVKSRLATSDPLPSIAQAEYDKRINDLIAEKLLKSNPSFDEDYDKDRLKALSKFSPYELNIIKNSNLASKVEPSIWQKFEQGLLSLNAGPVQYKNENLTPEEAKDENTPLNILTPLSIPGKVVQSLYRPGYTVNDALRGKANNAGIVEDLYTDPLNYMGLGLVKGAGKLPGLNKVLKTANKVGDVLTTQTPLKYLKNNTFVDEASKKFYHAGLDTSVDNVDKGFKSEINWGEWNKEIPNNKDLLDEYHDIEQTTKANGTWMKNPDGSNFIGEPAQFVQQQSGNFKKAYPNGVEKVYRGTYNEMDTDRIAQIYPKGRGIFTGDLETARHYAGEKGKLNELYHPSTSNSYDIDVKGRSWREVPIENLPNMQSKKTLIGKPVADTDDIATWAENNNVDYVNMRNIFDGVDAKFSRIVNNKPGNYLKSAIGNNGMFDMSNPNIYKGLVPPAIGAAVLQQQQENKYGGYINNDINTNYAMGGMIKRKDGSYSKRGLWDNIRANKGSGKKPTKEMLEQERKIKAKYADGGPLKYDMYGTPIESNIQPSNVERSYYDPRTDTIYLGTDYNQMDDNQKNNLLAHENYHSMQFKGDKSTFLPTDTGIKKPAMMSTDDVYYSYHNRQPIEAQQGIDDFRQANPSFNLVPDDLIYNNVVDYSQYLDPNTMEGGAKFYGDTGQPVDEDFYGKGGYIVTRSKDRKGKTHKVTGPDGTVKYFGDSKLGQHPNDPARKKAFYARHAKNLKNNPHFRAFARKTWADGGYMDKYNLGGDMQSGGNIAQRLNAGKVSRGSSGGNSFGDYAGDIGKIMLNNIVSPIEGLTGAEIYNPDYSTNLKGIGDFFGKTQTMAGKMLPMALNMVAPGAGTAVGAAGKAVGTGINSLKETEKNTAMQFAMGGFKPGALSHVNNGGTHEQNAMGGVPIGPNALVEEGETINNDFVFSDRLTPMGSKKTYAQLSKRIDSKYKLRPHDPLSKEAKQMELDNLAFEQESQKEMMSYGGVMAYGGKAFTGPVTQTVLNYNQEPSSMSNFMEPESVYENPVNSQILAKGGKIYIKPENRGKFNATKARTGKTTEELTHSKNPLTRKRAIFAQNAKKWKHAMGGYMYDAGGPLEDFSYDNPQTAPYPTPIVNPTVDIPLNNGAVPSYLQYDEMGNPISAQQMYNPNNESYVTNPFTTLAPITNPNRITQFSPTPTEQDLANYSKQMQGTNNAGAQNPYGKVGNVGYLTNLAGNLVKAGMVATSKPPIYNPSLRLNRLNSTPAERLAALEGRREIQGAKDLIRRNATSSGQYLTNASLLGASSADQMARNIANIRQGYDTQNVGIGNQEAQLNQQITAANNLAREQFRDNRLNQYNKILDSVIGANQQRFATDVHANNYQNQAIALLKTKDFHVGKKDKNGMFEVLDINGNIVGTLDQYGNTKDLLGKPIV